MSKTKCTLTDKELVEKIDKWNGKLLHTGGKAWSISVPPDLNNDPDLLLTELCKRFEDQKKELKYTRKILKEFY
ncbi:MAG: hypothetical protein WC139_12860 [Candidatus Kapaibacterium sp.]